MSCPIAGRCSSARWWIVGLTLIAGMTASARGQAVPFVAYDLDFATDFNLLLDPKHPEFAVLRPEAPTPFGFDPRMWKRGASS